MLPAHHVEGQARVDSVLADLLDDPRHSRRDQETGWWTVHYLDITHPQFPPAMMVGVPNSSDQHAFATFRTLFMTDVPLTANGLLLANHLNQQSRYGRITLHENGSVWVTQEVNALTLRPTDVELAWAELGHWARMASGFESRFRATA